MNLDALKVRSAPPLGGEQVIATMIMLVGVFLCYITLPDGGALDIFRHGAYLMGAAISLALLIQARHGVKNLFQADSVAIVTFYFLTYAEFLDPNLLVLHPTTSDDALRASDLVLLSFAGLTIGRHIPIFGQKLSLHNFPELSPLAVYRLFIVFSFLGYLYVLLSVNFDITEIFSSLLNPRFETPWQRGRLGDWSSLVEELSLLLYAVSAIGGYIVAKRRNFRFFQLLSVGAVLVFTVYFDIGTGARNYLAIQLGLFSASFLLSRGKPIGIGTILSFSVALVAIWLTLGFMLEYRNVGVKAFFNGDTDVLDVNSRMMIDNNMFSIANVMEIFPKYYDYPGITVLWNSIIHPIPRALWPGKPVEWNNSIEEVLRVNGATIAVTYAGEAFLMGGYIAAFFVSVTFGALAASWTRVSAVIHTNTGLVYYVSGFYAVTLGMRSMQWITVAILPTIAIYIMVRFLHRLRVRRIVTVHR